jgi:hypothetical protein
MTSIFHAFSMKYAQIAEVAPRLKDLGFTHVQFPPIQKTRVLMELDGDLLIKQLKGVDAHLEGFAALFKKARAKASAYPPHEFDYLLRRQIYTVNQPILREMYQAILDGVDPPALLEHLYNHPFYGNYIATSTYPYQAALTDAAALVLQIRAQPPPPTFSADELAAVSAEYDVLHSEVTALRAAAPESLRTRLKQVAKRQSQLWHSKHKHEAYTAIIDSICAAVPITSAIRSAVATTAVLLPPAKPPKRRPPFAAAKAKQWLDRMIICELLLYPPWWMIYQPMKLEIGDTHLGSREDILAAITTCRAHGLEVIADIVINNLAAVSGEKKIWEPFLARATPASATLADIIPADQYDAPPVQKLRELALSAFGADDLSIFTVPYECREDQDPTHCWMSGALPQLNQGHPVVQAALQVFIESLRAAGISGVRIDAAAHLKPHICGKVTDSFGGLSYIEYVGNAPREYEAASRLEDFGIGEDLYLHIFSEVAQTERLKNIGPVQLNRLARPDSVVMIINHDHVTGSIPSKVFSELPSQLTYELSVAYLIQRIYGSVLVMPHDIEFPMVRSALALRQRMREVGIVREYVSVNARQIVVEKYDGAGTCRFVAALNLSTDPIVVGDRTVQPLSFEWIEAQPDQKANTQSLKCIYNNVKNTPNPWNPWLRRYCYPQGNVLQLEK